MNRVAAAIPHWQELGRTTLGSAGDDITVSSLTNKPYLMTLTYVAGVSGTAEMRRRYNSDSSTSYANRRSYNGGTDAAQPNGTNFDVTESSTNNHAFEVSFINNLSSKEKLSINHSVEQNTAGSGNAPKRMEVVGKWTNTTNAISSVSTINTRTGDFDTGSELVVLGYDPADTGTSVWEELGTTTASGGEDILSVSVDKKYLWFEMYKVPSGDASADLQFNSDTGSNYAWRISTNGGADATGSSQVRLVTDRGAVNTAPSYISGYIINKSDKEKLVISEAIAQTTAGAGNAPQRRELVGKWANTSSAITSVDMINPEGGSFASGSILKVWGFN